VFHSFHKNIGSVASLNHFLQKYLVYLWSIEKSLLKSQQMYLLRLPIGTDIPGNGTKSVNSRVRQVSCRNWHLIFPPKYVITNVIQLDNIRMKLNDCA
jgi:hypothetical protein